METKWWNRDISSYVWMPRWLVKDFSFFTSFSPENSKRVGDTIIIQAILLILSGLILDGGLCAQFVLFASLLWWIGCAFILVRRPKSTTPTDVVFLKLGFLILLPVVVLSLPLWGWLRK